MTLETLLIVLAILAFVFVNVVQPWLRKRRADEQPGEAESANMKEVHVRQTVAIAAKPMPSQAPTTEPPAQHEAPRRAQVPLVNDRPVVLPLRLRRSALVSLADARRGMVLRTILGRCRAQQPFDSPSN